MTSTTSLYLGGDPTVKAASPAGRLSQVPRAAGVVQVGRRHPSITVARRSPSGRAACRLASVYDLRLAAGPHPAPRQRSPPRRGPPSDPNHRRPRPRGSAAWKAARSSPSARRSTSPRVGARRRRRRPARIPTTTSSTEPNPASDSHRSRPDSPACGTRPVASRSRADADRVGGAVTARRRATGPRPRARRAPRLRSPDVPT
jgi:hypothetical protein